MKVVVFGTALLACTIPAFGQVETRLQPSSPVITGSCQAAIFTPGVPSAVVVLTVPTLAAPAGGGLDSAQPLGTQSSMAPAQPPTFSRPSWRPAGIVSGGGMVSGIGRIERSGIGSIGTGGIGSIGTGGIGSIGMGGIGSIGMGGIGSIPTSSLGFPPSPTSSSSPFTAPLTQSSAVGSPSMRANTITHPLPVTSRQLPFICP